TILPYGLGDLKAFLNLNDTQVNVLLNVQKSQQQATQLIYQQINQKQQQLNALLESGSTNAAVIGQLTIDINLLRKQLPVKGEPYRSEALAVLAVDQRAKLAMLVNALQLGPAASEAVNLNLIDRPPVTIQPRLLAADMPTAE